MNENKLTRIAIEMLKGLQVLFVRKQLWKCKMCILLHAKKKSALLSGAFQSKCVHVICKTYKKYFKSRSPRLRITDNCNCLGVTMTTWWSEQRCSLDLEGALKEQKLVMLGWCPVAATDGTNCTIWKQMARKVWLWKECC